MKLQICIGHNLYLSTVLHNVNQQITCFDPERLDNVLRHVMLFAIKLRHRQYSTQQYFFSLARLGGQVCKLEGLSFPVSGFSFRVQVLVGKSGLQSGLLSGLQK